MIAEEIVVFGVEGDGVVFLMVFCVRVVLLVWTWKGEPHDLMIYKKKRICFSFAEVSPRILIPLDRIALDVRNCACVEDPIQCVEFSS